VIKGIRWTIFGLLVLCMVFAVSLVESTYQFLKNTPEDAFSGGKQRIIAVVPGAEDVDIVRIREEVRKSGERYGAYVEVYEAATAAEQQKIIGIAADSEVDGVLLYPMEESGYGSALERCHDKGIPVVVISQRLEEAVFDTFIGAAETSERMAVLSCVSATGGNGTILVVDRLNSDNQLCMEAAVLEPEGNHLPPFIPELKTKVSGLVSDPFVGYQVKQVKVIERQQSTAYSLYTDVYKLLDVVKPDAVFSYDKDITAVIASCLTSADNLPDIYAVGYGDLKESSSHLLNGTLGGLVQQNDAYSAAVGVRYLVQLRKGSVMPSKLDSGFNLISPENLERMLAGE